MEDDTKNKLISLAVGIVLIIALVFTVSNTREKALPCNTGMSDKQVFTTIYDNNIWGEGTPSGAGAIKGNAIPFLTYFQDFIDSNDITSIVDIGCGDWELMKHIHFKDSIDYVGVDLVDKLIADNQKKYSKKNIRFESVNSMQDLTTYKADLLVIKDVMQHWDNQTILYAIKNIFPNFKYAIIVNNFRTIWANAGSINSNIHMGDSRPLDLEAAPYFMKLKLVNDYKLPNRVKRIYLYTNPRLKLQENAADVPNATEKMPQPQQPADLSSQVAEEQTVTAAIEPTMPSSAEPAMSSSTEPAMPSVTEPAMLSVTEQQPQFSEQAPAAVDTAQPVPAAAFDDATQIAPESLATFDDSANFAATKPQTTPTAAIEPTMPSSAEPAMPSVTEQQPQFSEQAPAAVDTAQPAPAAAFDNATQYEKTPEFAQRQPYEENYGQSNYGQSYEQPRFNQPSQEQSQQPLQEQPEQFGSLPNEQQSALQPAYNQSNAAQIPVQQEQQSLEQPQFSEQAPAAVDTAQPVVPAAAFDDAAQIAPESPAVFDSGANASASMPTQTQEPGQQPQQPMIQQEEAPIQIQQTQLPAYQ